MDKLSSKSEIQKYGCLGSTKYGSVDYSEMYNIQCCFFLKEQSHVTYWLDFTDKFEAVTIWFLLYSFCIFFSVSSDRLYNFAIA